MLIVFKLNQTPLQLLKFVFSQWTQITKVMLTTELCWYLNSLYGEWDSLPHFFPYIFLFKPFWVFLTSWTIRADCAFLLHGQGEAHTGLRQLQFSSRIRIMIHQKRGKGRQAKANTMPGRSHILLALWYHRAHGGGGELVPYTLKGLIPQRPKWLCLKAGWEQRTPRMAQLSLSVSLHGSTQES